MTIKDILAKVSKPEYNSFSGDDALAIATVKGYLSTGVLECDVYLGGGFAQGRAHEIYGVPGSGKTSLAYSTAIQTIRKHGYVFWIDSEVAFNEKRFRSMGGDPSKVVVSHPDTLETGFVYVRDIIQEVAPAIYKLEPEAPILLVWDSVNGAAPRSIFEGNDPNSDGMGYRQRKTSDFCKWLTIPLAKSGVCFLALNQVSANIGGGYGAPAYNSAGVGNQFKHTMSTRMLIDAKGKGDDGQVVKFKIDKLRFEKSYRKWEVWMSYYHGFVEEVQIHGLATNEALGVMVKKGRTMYMADDLEFKNKICPSNYEGFWEVVGDNPELRELIVERIKIGLQQWTNPVNFEPDHETESNAD